MLWYEVIGPKSRRLLNYLSFKKAQEHGWKLSFNSKCKFYLQGKFIVNGIEYGLCTMATKDTFIKQFDKIRHSLTITSKNVTTKKYENNLF